MAPKYRIFAVVASLALSVAPPVLAQRGDSGSITGYVFDQTGSPLSGVKISAESPTQIGGRKTTYSNAEGSFRFPVVEPGKFKVKAEAPKLQTVVQDVTVGLNAPVEVNLVMEVASTKVEEVKVVEKAPVVSVTTPNVKEVFDIEFVETMPHDNRDVIFQQITNYAAGVRAGGRVRGGGGGQTLYMMDGFNMLNQYPTVKASAAYEMQTASYGAENSMASGGVVNLVTRSGSNKFEAEMNASMDQSRLNFFDRPGSLDPVESSHLYVINPMVSGPIIKDKLWYSVNAEFLTRKTGRDAPVGFPEIRPEFRHWHKGTVKLSWQVTGRNKLQSIFNWDEFYQFNRDNHASNLILQEEAQRRFRSRNNFYGLIWESLLTDNIIFRSQVAYTNIERNNVPMSCNDDPSCLEVPIKEIAQPIRTRFGNAEFAERGRHYSMQMVNRLEFFANGLLGEHHIQLQDHYLQRNEHAKRNVPGGRVLEWTTRPVSGEVPPDFVREFYSNDPRVDEGGPRFDWHIRQWRSQRNAVSLSDRWRPTRHLTIIPGAAFVWASADNNKGGEVMSATDITPSGSVVWDATHDGRTRVSGSVAKYVDAELHGIASHTGGDQVSRRCKWNPATQAHDLECEYSGGRGSNTVGLPCGPDGLDEEGRGCIQKLRLPRVWEYVLGAQREVTEGTALGVDAIYRKYTHQLERFETNRIWNASGTRLEPTGQFRNGLAQTISDLETPESARRTYKGITTSLSRREGRFKLQGSYTWSKLEGTVQDGTDNPLGDNPARDIFLYGYLPDDHRHEIKLNLQFRFTKWLGSTFRYAYFSGSPYNRRFRNDLTGSFEDLRARVGVNPGTNLNDPADDRELRTPDVQNFNAQLAVNFQPLIGADLEAWVDILNVLALRTTTSVQQNEGTAFGQSTGWEGPMRLRLGARYRF